ncbi:putative zinc-binding oxidoreductase ToxD [Bimuria novae-zelandiae CBS 107.79]|uniref:Putative zinc-binding oxidoreductase ToxD n=1 Tax=Bimuria novae-zelandiae CBS 107.79 TaxID=1447943 RepID=A0A6A5UUP9_9PLEO|nr:putative zinc-binding oxidoreductase ToxD [Bimuria novae-zelandiae CBS 107.79]
MKAIKIVDTDKAELVTDATLTKDPCPDELLLKTVAVALNPTDWKHVGFGIPTRPTVGCDFAGVVEDVGPAVTRFKKGDRVWGMVHGSNQLRPDNAAFQEYLYAKEGVTVKIADDMSFEEAASLGGMYQEMPIPWPNNPLREKKQILIYGGSSATGALGIQFAKLSGFEVLTTAGKNNFDYVKSLGADAVFDSRSLTVGEEIREYTKDKLCYVWDTIGEYGSDEASAKALASKAPDGQKLYYGTILLKDITDFVARRGTLEPRPDDVIQSMSLGYTAVGEAFEIKGTKFPARPEDYEFAKKWMQFAGELIAQGKIKPHRVVSRYGGFESLVDGLEDLKNGVSGVKLVYQVAQVAEP